jgi:hypothetical protein
MGTNLMSAENSSFEGGTTGSWVPMTNVAIANRAGIAYDGSHCLQYSAVANGMVQVESGQGGILGSTYYSFALWVLGAAAPLRTISMYALYYDINNTYISSSDQVAAPERNGQWSELLLLDLSPGNAAYVRVVVTIPSATAGEVHYLDYASVQQGAQPPASGQGAGMVATQLFQISSGTITLDMSPDKTWTNGIAIATKDLGGPAVREVTYDHSQMNGADDLTKFFGQRVVNITGTCFGIGSQSRSVAWERLAPFLDPGIRSTLNYALDLDVGARKLTNLRLAAVERTANSPTTFGFQVQWAADPISQALSESVADIASSSGAGGRTYPRVYGLMYPSGSGTVNVWSSGLIPAWPIYTIYGPCTNPVIALTDSTGAFVLGQIALSMGLAGGHYVTINARSRTITIDGTTDGYHTIDLSRSSWVPIKPGNNWLRYTGASVSAGSHCQVVWNDSFLY